MTKGTGAAPSLVRHMVSSTDAFAHLEVVARRVEGVGDEAIELMVLLHRDLGGRLRPERVDRVGPRAVNPAHENRQRLRRSSEASQEPKRLSELG